MTLQQIEKVYELVCDSGQYEDGNSWTIGTFTTLEQAEQVKADYEKVYQQWKDANPLNLEQQKAIKAQPFRNEEILGEELNRTYWDWEQMEFEDGNSYSVTLSDINHFAIHTHTLNVYLPPAINPESL